MVFLAAIDGDDLDPHAQVASLRLAAVRRFLALYPNPKQQVGELFARAIFPAPWTLLQRTPATVQAQVHWLHRPAMGRITGNIFSDGSSLRPLLCNRIYIPWLIGSRRKIVALGLIPSERISDG